ncbi:hypothetical protein OE810_03270 [Rhodobacteraceae bacterium XHP0102]|nr:hypothetical protein [Rhodobacteraceae bacterium XHP0102]
MQNPKICIGPTEVAGVAKGLAHGFQRLGCECKVVLGYPHPFAYGDFSAPTPIHRAWLWLGKRRNNSNIILNKIFFVLLHRVIGFFILIIEAHKSDIFIFICGEAFSQSRLDYIYLSALKRKSIAIYLGSDSRPCYIDGAAGYSTHGFLARLRRQKKNIRNAERYFSHIINNPAGGQLHQKKFINWFILGVPSVHREHADAMENSAQKSTVPVRALHAPSSKGAKGTAEILKIIDNLKAAGHRIDLKLLSGVPNSEVIEAIKQCDFVIDQLYSDTPMAAFATEAATLGKVSVVGGYFSEDIRRYLPEHMIPPTLYVHPEKVHDAVEFLLSNPDKVDALSEKIKSFVTDYWSIDLIAERYLRLFNDDIPDEWWVDPYEIDYVGGCGLSEIQAARNVRDIIEAYGPSALGVDDKPRLLQKLIALSEKAD